MIGENDDDDNYDDDNCKDDDDGSEGRTTNDININTEHRVPDDDCRGIIQTLTSRNRWFGENAMSLLLK